MYFSLLLAERYVINVGEVDTKKTSLCPKCLVLLARGMGAWVHAFLMLSML